MPDVAEIAGRLSDAQREALLFLSAEPTQIRGGVRYMPLKWLGLCEVAGDWNAKGRQYRLTETGLAVRAYLENSREQ